ncbi:uncharacterized protein PV06_02780 [Exophiala oligosperma]|uniref:3-oxoacyl-[acyl-carrier-protein] reductase n=1 Tax=Exophiala oligosperma TaxID=215243 RepID=A0A0D2EGU8_9EURO|nr:uncharacterized protein PV06_02780 [Exophiala oligosperma]KIW47184.1 hypothetical protein PV06_02780 [Exophiala oligosperma]
MSSLGNKVIAITGGASGIGLATAKLLIARGASVAISDIDERNLSLAKASLPSAATTLLDVRNSKAVTRWIDATIERFGRLDGAANLAGVSGIGGLVQDEADDLWDLVVGVNAKGVYNCLRAQIPRISDGGSIVNAASVAGLVGIAQGASYTASKHAVVGLTRCTARENPKIRINAIAPGVIATPMTAAVDKDIDTDSLLGRQIQRRMGTPEEMAEAIAFLLSDSSAFTTGSVYSADGGYTA